jgi:hypothetical protein
MELEQGLAVVAFGHIAFSSLTFLALSVSNPPQMVASALVATACCMSVS